MEVLKEFYKTYEVILRFLTAEPFFRFCVSAYVQMKTREL